MKVSFFCKICSCFYDEWKRDNEEIVRLQDQEWELATNSIRESKREEEKWKSKKEAHILIQIKNPPFVLNRLRRIFAFLFLLSGSKWIAGTKKHEAMIGDKDFSPYRCVEWYVIGWSAFELVALIYLLIVHGVLHRPVGSVEQVVFVVLIFPLCYRLFDIFQSWVGQFVLRSTWNTINVNRSLVLAIVGYIEITMIGAIVRFRFQQPILVGQSLYDSVASMIASPGDKASAIQYTQIMFAVLFAAVVVQHVVGRLSGNKSYEEQSCNLSSWHH